MTITVETIRKTLHLHGDAGQFQAQLSAGDARALAAQLLDGAASADAWEIRQREEQLAAKRFRLQALESEVAAMRAELGE